MMKKIMLCQMFILLLCTGCVKDDKDLKDFIWEDESIKDEIVCPNEKIETGEYVLELQKYVYDKQANMSMALLSIEKKNGNLELQYDKTDPYAVVGGNYYEKIDYVTDSNSMICSTEEYFGAKDNKVYLYTVSSGPEYDGRLIFREYTKTRSEDDAKYKQYVFKLNNTSEAKVFESDNDKVCIGSCGLSVYAKNRLKDENIHIYYQDGNVQDYSLASCHPEDDIYYYDYFYNLTAKDKLNQDIKNIKKVVVDKTELAAS